MGDISLLFTRGCLIIDSQRARILIPALACVLGDLVCIGLWVCSVSDKQPVGCFFLEEEAVFLLILILVSQ